MQDRFLMRGGFGLPYEVLWANPHQPGLSYFQAPLLYHDSLTGHLFARTSWVENANWLGYFDGQLQFFRDGEIEPRKPGAPLGAAHWRTALARCDRNPQMSTAAVALGRHAPTSAGPSASCTSWASPQFRC